MEDLQIFSHQELGDIRVLFMDDEFWFFAEDVCNILGYEKPDNFIREYIDDKDKLIYGIDKSGQNHNMLMINKSGLNSLILSNTTQKPSDLLKIEKFSKWIIGEVLPAMVKKRIL